MTLLKDFFFYSCKAASISHGPESDFMFGQSYMYRCKNISMLKFIYNQPKCYRYLFLMPLILKYLPGRHNSSEYWSAQLMASMNMMLLRRMSRRLSLLAQVSSGCSGRALLRRRNALREVVSLPRDQSWESRRES